jgi:catechol 2,3-dioxygenase-like lactoylglutathione lyase family enzyme
MRLDGVQIGVEDLEAAARAYEILLGCAPTRLPSGAQRFQLQRGAVELQPGVSGLQSIRFADGPRSTEGAAFNGLVVHFDAAAETQLTPPHPGAIDAIDHVVIHSPNLDRAIALWRDKLGLRLALDREFPARGLRMLFFRSGGITLEFVGAIGAPADAGGPDRFSGLAYRVRDLNTCRDRLLQAGFDVSAIRMGHKPKTSVATVRSGTGDVPTLLLEDPSRGE